MTGQGVCGIKMPFKSSRQRRGFYGRKLNTEGIHVISDEERTKFREQQKKEEYKKCLAVVKKYRLERRMKKNEVQES